MTQSIVVAVALLGIAIASSSHLPAAQLPDCAPAGGVSFVCGLNSPEDLVLVPNTKWLIASGTAGGGLHLIDTQAKTAREFVSPQVWNARPDKTKFGNCPGPLDPNAARLHGLNLRSASTGQSTLYAVNHGGRESIEVFEVDARGSMPSATWIGCVLLPDERAGNSVATFSDGTILVTVMLMPGKTYDQFFSGQPTGVVLMWTPRAKEFRALPGTELSGNNGVETSADDREFYVVATGSRQVFAFSRTDTATPLRVAQTDDFRPDNLRRIGDRLITAGIILEEPACGGRIKKPEDVQCPRGWVGAWIDPKTMAVTEIARGPANPLFRGASVAVPVGNELWIGAFAAGRVAYRPFVAR